MIITKQKNFDEILRAVQKGPVFIAGCNECAKMCGTGGQDEVLAMKQALEKQHIPVTGWIVLEPACHLQNDKRLLKASKDDIAKAEKILLLTCGNGVQTVAEVLEEKEVVSGADTLFVGEIMRLGEYQKRCALCGDCLVDTFGGFCPVSRCPKSMLNGPCGGSTGGKCEIDKAVPCVWDQMYHALQKHGKVQVLTKIQKPKDWSKSTVMNRSM